MNQLLTLGMRLLKKYQNAMIKSSYSLNGYLKLLLSLVRTKLFFTNARIIRFPIDIRGKSKIDFGLNLTTGVGCRLEVFSEEKMKKIIFGHNVQLNDYVHISSMKEVRIGNNVLMASRIYISDNSHGIYKGSENDTSPDIAPLKRRYLLAAVCIEDNVWIAEGVVIMPGVTIGKGSIIGANAVVTKNIPPYSIAVGQPATVMKKFDFTISKWVPV